MYIFYMASGYQRLLHRVAPSDIALAQCSSSLWILRQGRSLLNWTYYRWTLQQKWWWANVCECSASNRAVRRKPIVAVAAECRRAMGVKAVEERRGMDWFVDGESGVARSVSGGKRGSAGGMSGVLESPIRWSRKRLSEHDGEHARRASVLRCSGRVIRNGGR